MTDSGNSAFIIEHFDKMSYLSATNKYFIGSFGTFSFFFFFFQLLVLHNMLADKVLLIPFDRSIKKQIILKDSLFVEGSVQSIVILLVALPWL